MTRFAPLWLYGDGEAPHYTANEFRRVLGAIWPDPASRGGNASLAGGMNVQIGPIAIAVPAANGTGSVLCVSDSPETVQLPTAAGTGQNRIDLIIVRPRASDIGTTPDDWDWIFDVIQGPTGANPTPPAAPAGTAGIWQATVPGGSAAVGSLTDVRPAVLDVTRRPLGLLRWAMQSGGNAQHAVNNFASAWDFSITPTWTLIAGRSYRVRVSIGNLVANYSSGNGVANVAIARLPAGGTGTQLSGIYPFPTKSSGVAHAAFADWVGNCPTDIPAGPTRFAARFWGGNQVSTVQCNSPIYVTLEDAGVGASA